MYYFSAMENGRQRSSNRYNAALCFFCVHRHGAKIAEILRRGPEDVAKKVEELHSEVSSGPWNSGDLQTLKRLYGNRSNDDLVLILGRSVKDLESKALEICLAKDKGFRRRQGNGNPTRMPRWSLDDIGVLREMYSGHSNLDIAKRLNRTVKSVVSKAHDLGLKKSEERLRVMGRENVRVRYDENDQDPVSDQDQAGPRDTRH